MKTRRLCLLVLFCCSFAHSADWALEPGKVSLRSAGPIAFGPDDVLLVADVMAARIYAIATGESNASAGPATIQIGSVEKLLTTLLGATAAVSDLAAHQASGSIYLSVTANDKPALVRIDRHGKASLVDLSAVAHSQLTLPNPPADKVVGEGRRRGNLRLQSITDLAYINGSILVAGLSDDTEAASTVRQIAFPFQTADSGSALEIYHAAHGRYEDHSAIRTLVPMSIDGELNVLAGFVCTPLVRIPVADLALRKKIRGTTVAELGNRNRPLDMIVYEKGDDSFLLMANSARGVMKISVEGLADNSGLSERVEGGKTAGQPYETIADLVGVIQLDRLDDEQAIVLLQAENGSQSLKSIRLP